MRKMVTFDDRYGCHHEIHLEDRLFHRYGGTSSILMIELSLGMRLYASIKSRLAWELEHSLERE